MSKVNLVENNKDFFKRLKMNAVKREIPLTIKWAKMNVILGLKAYLQIEDKKVREK